MLKASKSVIRSNVAASIGRLADAVCGIAEVANDAVRAVAFVVRPRPSPQLVPVRVQARRHAQGR